MSRISLSEHKNTTTPTRHASNSSGLLQRKCSCGAPMGSLTDKCPDCKSRNLLQKKLVIGASSDPLEQEADRVADQVMARPTGSSVSTTPIHVQRYQATESSDNTIAPSSVDRVLASSGQPLEPALRLDMEQRFGFDFSNVRIHTNRAAEQSAQDVRSHAFTVGHDIVFGSGRFSPETQIGRHLLAHELTHVVQQIASFEQSPDIKNTNHLSIKKNAYQENSTHSHDDYLQRASTKKSNALGILQRVPVAPAWKEKVAEYNSAQVKITYISDITITSGSTIPNQTVTPVISTVSANHLSWELYDPSDKLLDGFSSRPSDNMDSLTKEFIVTDQALKRSLVQGRYRLRCIARKNGTPLAYADRTFFLNTSALLVNMNRAALATITGSPSTHSIGEIGASKARDMMLEHQASVASGGTGTMEGNQCTTVTKNVSRSDCTQYVYDILKYAFGVKGAGAEWLAVATEAAKLSGSGGLRGTALQTALETQAGWKGVFWAPSPRNPEDGTSEHPVAYKRVKSIGLYSRDNVAVENSLSIVDYRPKSATTMPIFSALDQLKKVPLGVISARGGTHMTLIINGQVYEVHWDRPATDKNVIQATPLEEWEWESGVIVMPAADFLKFSSDLGNY